MRGSSSPSKRVEGTPDLVIEVISQGTGEYDRVTKRRLYSDAGVKEYWLVDPDAQQVLVMRLGHEASTSQEAFTSQEASTPQEASTSTELFLGTSVLKSTLLGGFEVKLTDVFRV
ncbi:MAG: Uma2 family endonuclease [Bacillota bacterium]